MILCVQDPIWFLWTCLIFFIVFSVKFRAVVVTPDLLPYEGMVTYKLIDPASNIILLEKDVKLLSGVAGSEFKLGKHSTLGIWKLSYSVFVSDRLFIFLLYVSRRLLEPRFCFENWQSRYGIVWYLPQSDFSALPWISCLLITSLPHPEKSRPAHCI